LDDPSVRKVQGIPADMTPKTLKFPRFPLSHLKEKVWYLTLQAKVPKAATKVLTYILDVA
jgi:hypothetical protein